MDRVPKIRLGFFFIFGLILSYSDDFSKIKYSEQAVILTTFFRFIPGTKSYDYWYYYPLSFTRWEDRNLTIVKKIQTTFCISSKKLVESFNVSFGITLG